MKKLIIDRSRWLRGVKPHEESRLLLPGDGKMCCLGFYALECGFTEQQIHDMGSPADTLDENVASRNDWPSWVFSEDDGGDVHESVNIRHLMSVNDDHTLSEEIREAEIASTFAEEGIDVIFVDGPVTP
jgi:hypothetical protein